MTLPMGPFQPVSISKHCYMLTAILTEVLRGSHDRLNNAAGQVCKWQRPRFKQMMKRLGEAGSQEDMHVRSVLGAPFYRALF